MILRNIFKTLLNIGHIIYYRLYYVTSILIDGEIMRTQKQIDKNDDLVNDYIDSWYEGDDVAKILGHMDEDGDYIKEEQYKPYGGPICETP